MIFCFAGGAILLIAILGKYIHARLSLVVSWKVRYGQQSEGETNNTGTQSSAPALARRPSIATPRQQKSIYDRWLLLRFTIAFIALGYVTLILRMLFGIANSSLSQPLRTRRHQFPTAGIQDQHSGQHSAIS